MSPRSAWRPDPSLVGLLVGKFSVRVREGEAGGGGGLLSGVLFRIEGRGEVKRDLDLPKVGKIVIQNRLFDLDLQRWLCRVDECSSVVFLGSRCVSHSSFLLLLWEINHLKLEI